MLWHVEAAVVSELACFASAEGDRAAAVTAAALNAVTVKPRYMQTVCSCCGVSLAPASTVPSSLFVTVSTVALALNILLLGLPVVVAVAVGDDVTSTAEFCFVASVY